MVILFALKYLSMRFLKKLFPLTRTKQNKTKPTFLHTLLSFPSVPKISPMKKFKKPKCADKARRSGINYLDLITGLTPSS